MNEYESQVTSYFIKHFLFTAVIFFGIVFLVADYEAGVFEHHGTSIILAGSIGVLIGHWWTSSNEAAYQRARKELREKIENGTL